MFNISIVRHISKYTNKKRREDNPTPPNSIAH